MIFNSLSRWLTASNKILFWKLIPIIHLINMNGSRNQLKWKSHTNHIMYGQMERKVLIAAHYSHQIIGYVFYKPIGNFYVTFMICIVL